jgi:hypothetical protein
MCGIFGIISSQAIDPRHLLNLANRSRQRGRDSSGLLWFAGDRYQAVRADYDVKRLLRETTLPATSFVVGHSRLITNSHEENQPVIRDEIAVLHNGIIVNEEDVWAQLRVSRQFSIDTEAINGIVLQHIEDGEEIATLSERIFERCRGTISAAVVMPKHGQILLLSNNGSLFTGNIGTDFLFASERFTLVQLGCINIEQVVGGGLMVSIPASEKMQVSDLRRSRKNLVPGLRLDGPEEALLKYRTHGLRRCTRCILTETMPYIVFDESGVCNYCKNYQPRNNPRPVDELMALVEPYRRKGEPDCIVPFSGGRDSCWALHLIARDLGMRPVAYTYDWGMVTDLGRRNISRMCAALGVENIIIADDIGKKRDYIATNLAAWLRAPNLGMISILTSGDKHFFRHVETVKQQTGIQLNLWGVNPLEVTHFKAGFLGVPPDFEEKRVYMHGMRKQLNYQALRFRAMLQSPGYFNRSLWDTLSGEYYRSFTEKSDYFHIFDYWRWDEVTCDRVLAEYDWETAPDTNTTWRIGDGTAAFYNYLYYSIAGFTEHDTFRSNQIREGQLTRDEAMAKVEDENRPRYPNIRWYLDAIGMDFTTVISRVNAIPPLDPLR